MTEVIVHDPDLCTGCRQCMTACSFRNYKTYNYDLSLCKVIDGPHGEFIRVYCQQCRDPMCKAACPVEAIKKDEVTGFVTIDKMLCIGCKAMAKCDMCGGDPECIKVCSAKAIKLVSREDGKEIVRRLRK